MFPCGVQRVLEIDPKGAQSGPEKAPKRSTDTTPHPQWTLINTWQEWYMLHIGGEPVTPYFNDLRRLRLGPSLPRSGRFLTSFCVIF